jgi:23S rRNA (cytidine1920-2'-O)/16S rRNA (cytidine1409-2'-O)-methyltransferase
VSKPKKLRLDELLVTRGLCANVEEARRRIWAGEVIVGEEMVDQAGTRVPDEASLRLRSRRGRYASRGGEKLEHALRSFSVTTEGRTALDVGAAVGGFTDCLLAHGASRVYAVELGRGQLAQRLRLDSRVVDMSGRDILTVRSAELDPRPTLAVVDVTFCSLAALLPRVQELLSDEQETLALLKPLFEARLAGIGRVEDVQRRVFEWLLPRLQEIGLPVLDVIGSPLPGVGGAIEFFLHIRRPGRADADLWERVEAALSEARAKLSKRSRPARSGQKRRKKWKEFSSPRG